jgi:ferritin-like metal-binding protein YciE
MSAACDGGLVTMASLCFARAVTRRVIDLDPPRSPDSFGNEGAQIREWFEDLFGFAWDPTPEEEPDVIAARHAVMAIAKYEPPPKIRREDAAAWDLICEAEKLRSRIERHLRPLRDHLAQLDQVRARSREASAAIEGLLAAMGTSARSLRVRALTWACWCCQAAEHDLSLALDAMANGTTASSGPAIRGRIAEVQRHVLDAQECVAVVRGQRVARPQRTTLDEVGNQLTELMKGLEAINATGLPSCAALPYLTRIERALAPRTRTSPAGPSRVRLSPEVPPHLLRHEASREAARERVVLQLAVRCPAHYSSLPQSALREAAAAPVRGRGHRNVLFHGIAAALVLGGLVGRDEFVQLPNRNKHFAEIVRAVQRILRDHGTADDFWVSPDRFSSLAAPINPDGAQGVIGTSEVRAPLDEARPHRGQK